MKLGLLISILVLLAAAGAWWLITRSGSPDPATAATSPARLALVALPDDLPEVGIGGPANASSPIPHYDATFAYYQQHRSELDANLPSAEPVAALIALLTEAAEARGDSSGFLDAHLPIRIGDEPSFDDALEGAVDAALREARRRWDAGDREGALVAARAVWTLGERALRDNVRLYPRAQGVSILTRTGMMLYGWEPAPVPEAELKAWGDALQTIDEAWTPKLAIVRGIKPNIGDLIAIARRDADRTFRIEAMLTLGRVQHTPGGEPNRRAIRAAIADGRRDADPLVAEAAEEAAAFTIEQMRRLR